MIRSDDVLFLLLENYFFISDQNVRAKNNRIRDCIFHSKGHTLNHFFTMCIISMKTVQVDLIIGTTLVVILETNTMQWVESVSTHITVHSNVQNQDQ